MKQIEDLEAAHQVPVLITGGAASALIALSQLTVEMALLDKNLGPSFRALWRPVAEQYLDVCDRVLDATRDADPRPALAQALTVAEASNETVAQAFNQASEAAEAFADRRDPDLAGLFTAAIQFIQEARTAYEAGGPAPTVA